MCTFDDDSSRDVVMFIKIGQEMYLSSDVSGYLNGNLCTTNLAQCAYHLVRKPLQKISIVFPKKIFLIAVNFVDNCFRAIAKLTFKCSSISTNQNLISIQVCFYY